MINRKTCATRQLFFLLQNAYPRRPPLATLKRCAFPATTMQANFTLRFWYLLRQFLGIHLDTQGGCYAYGPGRIR